MPVVCRRPRLGAAFLLRALLTTTFALLVCSCGSDQLENGTPVITVTSTNTRFSSFIVSISSMTLTRSDGYTFTVLGSNAVAQRVDLTKLTDLGELMEAPAVPSGTYTAGTITLDLSAPIIYVAAAGGQAVAATPVDTSGNTLTTATLAFNLDPKNPLVINAHQGMRFGIEFDLAASTILKTTTSPAQVIFTPVVVPSIVPANNNPLRVRGLFLIADQKNSSIVLNSRPFDDQYNSSLGAVNITVDANTVYDLNGVVYTGSAGLAQVGTLALNAPIAAVGALTDVSPVTPVLRATQVYVGNSLEGPAVDHLLGYVSARTANTLNVHGTMLDQRGGVYSYVNDSTVTLGPSTIVNIDGNGTTGLTNQAVSVGQRVEIIGQASVNSTTGALTMDATAGEVRVQSTRLWGTPRSGTANALVLKSIGVFNAAAFNFAGTGVSAASDASAATYLVSAGSLDVSTLPANTALQLDGRVTPFGSAPPDFTASSVTSAIDSILQVEWSSPGTTAPFTSLNSSGLVVNLANPAVGNVHEIDTGPFSQDLRSLSASPLIVPDPVNGTNYSVGAGTALVLNSFTTFAAFATQATTELSTKAVRKLVAIGRYDAGTNTFTAKRVNLVDQ